ncbi:glycosyltransferase [Acinetobacter indicus]|uniref:glycosyltransferase n=1 Tax=Acinetobacter indicus TaxID=756892 RepID=UPI00136201AF|nr:glycosyltransferase [Acinetobacter indicus]
MSKIFYFVVHNFSQEVSGGVNRVVAETANELCKNSEIDINILSLAKLNGTSYPVDSRINLHSLNMKKYSTTHYKGILKIVWLISTFFFMLKFLKDKSKDNLIFNLTSPPLIILFALFFKRKNFKLLFCEHSSPLNKKRSNLYHLVRNFILKRGDLVIALNKKDYEFYKSQNIKTQLIHNGITFPAHLVDKKSKKIIFVGRFANEKNPLEALSIFKESKLWIQDYKLYFYGYGPLKAQLLQKISEFELLSNVFIIEGETNRDIIYKDACCLIMTSKYEGFGMVLVEAMSYGIPCIAYNCPEGPSDIIIDDFNGYLIPLNERNIFIDRLSCLSFKDLDVNEVKGSIVNYSISKIASKWISIIF